MSSEDRSKKLRAARRRNAHRLRGDEFLASLRTRAGWTESQEIELLEPSASIEFEGRTYARLRQGIADGSIKRSRHLSLDEAVDGCRDVIERSSEGWLSVILCRSPDFIFRVPTSLLASALRALVEFDGDSVTAARDDGAAGFALDIETEAFPSPLYEVDSW